MMWTESQVLGKRSRKIRVDFRKNRQPRARRTDWTRQFEQGSAADQTAPSRETIRPKGELSRRRTILVDDAPVDANVAPVIEPGWLAGRVLSVTGNVASVETTDGRTLVCAVSRVLRTIAIGERSALAAGDRVLLRLTECNISGPNISEPEGASRYPDSRLSRPRTSNRRKRRSTAYRQRTG
jgi:hypothetical protein